MSNLPNTFFEHTSNVFYVRYFHVFLTLRIRVRIFKYILSLNLLIFLLQQLQEIHLNKNFKRFETKTILPFLSKPFEEKKVDLHQIQKYFGIGFYWNQNFRILIFTMLVYIHVLHPKKIKTSNLFGFLRGHNKEPKMI
jgi:hypothetical protein